MKKILIADHYRGSLEQMHSAMAEHGRTAGRSIYSLRAFQDEESVPREALNLQYHQLLMKQKDHYHVYGDMFRFPSFIDEILRFAGECVLYDIREENLPADDDSEAELKKIVGEALKLDLPEKKLVRMTGRLGEQLEELKKDSTVEYIPSFASSVFNERVRRILAEHVTCIREEEYQPQEKRRYADSDHQEIEAVIQDIVRRLNEESGMRFNIVCTNPSVQTEILDMASARYGLSCSVVNQTRPSVLLQRWYALCDYALHPDDMVKFNEAVSCGAFGKTARGKADVFLRTSMSSLKVDDSLMEKIRASVYRGHQDEIQAETESVQKYLDSIADEIESLIRADSARARAAAAFNIVRQQAHAQTEIMEGMALRKMLSSCLGFVDTDEDLSYLMEICRQKTGSETVLGSDQVVVTDLRHPVRSADVTYVIGCSEDFYPGFKVRDGLFDEAYTAKIERYPSMGERLDLYRRELAWVSHSARRELIYSMASVDYDGKEKAWYVELDERISDLAKWHLIMRRPMAADPCQIDHDSVQASLMKEGKIVTSVTASERYFSCPMAWFYQDGLRVNQPTPLGLDAASMGTLWHAMMEDAFRNRKTEDGKSYTDWREEEIRDYLDRQFDVLRHLLPGMKVRVDLTEEKMVHHTVILMKWLKDMEDETVYEPKEAELKFREVPVTRDGCVLVNGRIDRVDHFGDHNFRVIDYKSGSDKFSPSRFAAGLQTQLVTYMLIYETMHEEMKPAGAWYCHLNPAVSAGTGAHTAGRGRNMELVLSSFDEAEMREMAYAARKMHGVLLDDVQADGIDETGGTFCVFSRLPEVEDHATMEGMLDEIYRLFYKGVENGSFPAEPVKGACSFCLLKGICRFKGREKNPEVLLKVVK